MKKLLLLAAGLLAGCRSEQVAFQFQPVASALVAARPVATPTPVVPAEVATSALALPPATGASTPAAATLPAAVPPLRHQPIAKLAHALPPLAVATAPMRAAQHLAQRISRRHATSGAAESGLGNIGLFFIGVVLAVLAGLAALVNVIFDVGFFTALGYTAGGLVVLFLLYSLLSGSGKKK